MDWIGLAQGSAKWRVIVNTAEEVSASEKGLCSKELIDQCADYYILLTCGT